MNSFRRELRAFHRARLAGRVVAAGVAALGVAVLVALAVGVADAAYAFSGGAREGLRVVLVVAAAAAAVAAVVWGLWRSIGQSARDASRLLGDRRELVAGAEALREPGDGSPLTAYLAERARKEASESLRRIPARKRLPWKMIGGGLAVLLAGAAAGGGLWIWNKEAVRVVGQRIFWPERDVPPYSLFRFDLSPDAPAVVYGGEVLLTAEITGDEVDEDVMCLIREPASGEVRSLRAFRESRTRYARRIENVVAPIEVAFGVGKARSGWLPVEVLYQPRVTAAELRIEPPAHTGLAAERYPVEGNEIHAIEGSEVELTVTSNRPLSGGVLKLVPGDRRSDSAPLEVRGESGGPNAVRFRWRSRQSGELSVMIRDVRGTEAEAPLELGFRVDPDEAPLVDLASPDRLAFATPTARLDLTGSAEDDFGLARVQLVRTLVGYRDRAKTLADGLTTKDYDFDEPLDLGALGVDPGQTLEFYLEAADRNPTLLGVGSSPVTRVMVISEEDYAARIRARTTLKEFSARYTAAARVLDEAARALEGLAEAAREGDAEAAGEARREALARHEEAARLLEDLAEDFPAFALEERLAQAAKKAAQALEKNIEVLGELNPEQVAAAMEAVRRMQERIGRERDAVREVQASAEQVAQVGRVMEMAAGFQRLYKTQSSIATRFGVISEEIMKGVTRNRVQLESLATVQDRNREGLREFAEELAKRAEELPEEFAELRGSAEVFLAAMKHIDIESPMEAAAKCGRGGRAVDASSNAELAKLQMEQLMKRSGDCFGKMCGGCMPEFQVLLEVNLTMAQLMEALMMQLGGQGIDAMGGTGAGFGGTGREGFPMIGQSLDIPIYGPDRLRFRSMAMGGKGEGSPAAGGGPRDASETTSLDVNPERESAAAVLRAEKIPEAYRAAVQRYFAPGRDEEDENTNHPNRK